MTVYDFEGGESSWLFCSTCGSHVTSVAYDDGSWTVATSIFVDHGLDNFYINQHIFSKSTKDGGVASMLSRAHGRQVKDWNPPDGDPSANIVEATPEFDAQDGQQRLRAKCHCGGVSFTIKRPDQETISDPSTSPYVSPLDKTKWFATLDACSDCRLVNGTHLVGWAFVPRASCEPPIKRDLLIGTAKTFSSSPGVLRSFCGTCGATVFYSTDERYLSEDKHVVDLATGILRAPEGSMATEWLTWRTKIAWSDSGRIFNEAVVESLSEGISLWSANKYGQELWQDIP